MMRNTDTTEVTEERVWHDGFIVLASPTSCAAHERHLRRLSDDQWDAGKKLLKQGFTLGVLANPVDAVDAVAHAAARWKLPLIAQYNEDDSML